jgi:tetratricopeptide (TPR) repeat protein
VWLQYAAFYLGPLGRYDEAISATQKALALDPLSPILQVHLGIYCMVIKQYDRAIAQCGAAPELNPHLYVAHFWLSVAYIQAGMVENGVSVIKTAIKDLGQNHFYMTALGFAHAKAGQIPEAQEILDQLNKLAQKTYVPEIFIGMIYLGLGKIEESFNWLEKAVDGNNSFSLFHLMNSIFEPLRSHPRYKALLRKMNLEPS